MKKLKHLRYCSCGEIYSHDGWNINEDGEMGNNYRYRSTDCFVIKYTTCTKCGKQVILQKSKKGIKINKYKKMRKRIEEEKNPAHYCLSCNKYLGFRGFCSQKCHDEYYDDKEVEKK